MLGYIEGTKINNKTSGSVGWALPTIERNRILPVWWAMPLCPRGYTLRQKTISPLGDEHTA